MAYINPQSLDISPPHGSQNEFVPSQSAPSDSENNPASSSSDSAIQSQVPGEYRCRAPGCSASFLKKHKRNAHYTREHPEDHKRFPCDHEDCANATGSHCANGVRYFGSKTDRDRHYNSCHDPNPIYYRCRVCIYQKTHEDNVRQHMKRCHRVEWNHADSRGHKPIPFRQAPAPPLSLAPPAIYPPASRTEPIPPSHTQNIGDSFQGADFIRPARSTDGRHESTSLQVNLPSGVQTKTSPMPNDPFRSSNDNTYFAGAPRFVYVVDGRRMESPTASFSSVRPELPTLAAGGSPKSGEERQVQVHSSDVEISSSVYPTYSQHLPQYRDNFGTQREHTVISALVDEALPGYDSLMGSVNRIVKAEKLEEWEQEYSKTRSLPTKRNIMEGLVNRTTALFSQLKINYDRCKQDLPVSSNNTATEIHSQRSETDLTALNPATAVPIPVAPIEDALQGLGSVHETSFLKSNVSGLRRRSGSKRQSTSGSGSESQSRRKK